MRKTLSKGTFLKVKNLRKHGYSIPEISRVVGVSKSTALRYAKVIKILPRYRARWLARRNASKIISERNWLIAYKEAERTIKVITKRDISLVIASLYWGEGAKADLSFSNTDPNMIRVFMYAMRRVFNVPNDDFKISIRIYEDLDEYECIRFWSKIVGIPLKGRVSINVLKGSKLGKLKYGMCRIRIRRGGLILKRLSAIIMKITELTSS